MTQRETILNHLQKYGSISPLEARHVYGIERLASRVDELRQSGFKLTTSIKKDAKGKRYAEYAFTPGVAQASAVSA
jgi:hypothetical protein